MLDGHCFVSLVLPRLPFAFILFFEPVDTRPRGMELKKDRAQEMRANHRTQNIYVTALVIEWKGCNISIMCVWKPRIYNKKCEAESLTPRASPCCLLIW